MFKKIAFAAALVIASAAASAQQAPQWYAGVDASSTKIEGADREGGGGVFVGYTFSPNLAVEAGWHRLAEADLYYWDLDARAKAKFDQTDISLIGTLPLSNGFGVYGRLGYNHLKIKASARAGNVTVSESDSEDKVLYGLGLSYAFSPQIAGRLEVQKPHSDITKVAVGVGFNF
ncbi:porin family protein [Massilia sp. YIM B02769]|uniref:porin family protein n=1 Tax=Massilia sp. YIM B02769 TaxID=3050129 RepID=UPI0025B6E1C4|nr:porin family protein [Massilia sp. YIM B02769]MDN4058422.1 porin family protein [Massilia sp. YIM B02769]